MDKEYNFMVTVANGRYRLPETLFYSPRHVFINKEELMVGLDEIGYAFLKNPTQIVYHVEVGDKVPIGKEFVTIITDHGMTTLDSPCEGVVKSININALDEIKNDAYERGFLLKFRNIGKYSDSLVTGDQVEPWARQEAARQSRRRS